MWPSVIPKLTTTNTNAPVMTTALHYVQAKKSDDLPRQAVNLRFMEILCVLSILLRWNPNHMGLHFSCYHNVSEKEKK